VGISDERVSQINALLGRELAAEEVEAFRQILHGYKKGKVEGDDLVAEITRALGAHDALVSTILEKVFPEFRELKAEATTRTLRSHMTSGWFITLSHLHSRRKLPLRLFSVDRCFRREQAEDAARLMSYYSASCVIMDEDVSVEDGKAVADGLLSQFGFQKFQFRPMRSAANTTHPARRSRSMPIILGWWGRPPSTSQAGWRWQPLASTRPPPFLSTTFPIRS